MVFLCHVRVLISPFCDNLKIFVFFEKKVGRTNFPLGIFPYQGISFYSKYAVENWRIRNVSSFHADPSIFVSDMTNCALGAF